MNARRVVVPRRPAAVQRAPVPLGLDGPDGDAEVRKLMGRQARRALVTVAAVVAVLVALPLLTSERDWLLVTLAVQPLWVALAVLQLRRAERAEHAEREP